jgi:fatty acid desaturase
VIAIAQRLSRRSGVAAKADPSPARAKADRADLLLVALAGAHAAVLMTAPAAPVIAIGLWWNANTISHYFIHRPFFRRRGANRAFAAYLSMLLGFPHALWRDRHLAHHARVATRLRLSVDLLTQTALVLVVWTAMLGAAPTFFLSVYLPGWAAGLLLCAAHGYYEHAHGTTSHYGRLYNLLLFNDGYHVEHHASPSTHWTRLPAHLDPGARVSRWPAPMRWLESDGLIVLERLALHSAAAQRFLVRAHERAFHAVLARACPFCCQAPRIAIVGGGLFPRTALVLRRILPNARLTIIDANLAHLNAARGWELGGEVEFVHQRFVAGPPATSRLRSHRTSASFRLRANLRQCASAGQVGVASLPPGDLRPRQAPPSPPGISVPADGYDLVVLPLSFEGDRDAIYRRPPARAVIVHDWLWRKRGVSRVVSLALLKRINLIRP